LRIFIFVEKHQRGTDKPKQTLFFVT